MWAIVAVTLHLLAGPDVWPVSDAGTFADKAACEAEIAKAVPAKLNKDHAELHEAGALTYVCVKVLEGNKVK